MMSGVIAAIVGYVLGSVLFGVLVPRLAGVDIYTVGSGNPGTANVARTMGRRLAAATVIGDIAKGAVAAAIGLALLDSAGAYGAGFAAVVGHCFPVWRPAGGGKGVATSIGALLVASPWVGVASLVVWAAQLSITRVASTGSLLLAAMWVPAVMVAGGRSWDLVWTAAMSILVIARHHENIRRLVTGTERRVG